MSNYFSPAILDAVAAAATKVHDSSLTLHAACNQLVSTFPGCRRHSLRRLLRTKIAQLKYRGPVTAGCDPGHQPPATVIWAEDAHGNPYIINIKP